MENLFSQLRERQIFKVATIYVVSAWPLIQIADIAVPALGLPESVLPLLFKVFLVGFPISLIFAWLLNFTAKGIVRADAEKAGDSAQKNRYKINLRAFATVGGALLFAFLITLGSQLVFNPENTQQNVASNLGDTIGNSVSNDPKKSIAVLPFDVLSKDTEDEYFIDGMVEELLNVLAKIPELQVAARTSSFSFKGVTDKTIVEIGRELGVSTILEGSIRKDEQGNRIRITAQLIDVESGAHIWSETYDREYRDIFQIQDEIAKAVAEKLKATLLGTANEAEFIVGTQNVDAMVEYGKGQKELSHRTATSIKKALEHFQAALSIDNNYAHALVGVSDAYLLLELYGSIEKENAFKQAQEALDKALALDPDLGAAYASQGLLFSNQHKNKEAIGAFKKAIELNPSYAMAYMWYGSVMQNMGDFAGAQALYNKAFELDPKSPVAAFNVAWGHYLMGAETKAMEWFSKIVANDPYYPGAYILVGNILSERGRLDEAIDMYQRVLQIDPLNKNAVSSLIKSTTDIGEFDRAQNWFDYLDNHPSILSNNERYLLKARFFAAQGKLDQAIASFNQLVYGPADNMMRLNVAADVAYYQGNYAEAANYFEELKSLSNELDKSFFYWDDGTLPAHLALAYESIGEQNKANELLVEYERRLLNDKNKNANSPKFYYNMALLHALRDADESAFNYLQAAIDTGWVQVWHAEIEPIFKKLASKPRFSQMMGGVDARLAYMRNRLKDPDAEIFAER